MSDEEENCPFCSGKPLPEDKQPYPGLHAYTMKYHCGTEIVYVIGHDAHDIIKCCLSDDN